MMHGVRMKGKANQSTLIKKTHGDRVFDAINYTILTILMLVVLYPLYVVVISSVSEPDAVNAGQVILHPVGFTWAGYTSVFKDASVWSGYRNSILYMATGTLLALVLTLTAAYPLSRRDMMGRKLLMKIYIFTMYFSGGMVPLFIIVNRLGLYGSPVVIVLLGCFSTHNMIITRAFFMNNIPHEMLEAARVDGCGDFTFFMRIVLPLSTTIIAVLTVYYGIAYWNTYYTALLFLTKEEHMPLQIILRQILDATKTITPITDASSYYQAMEQKRHAELIKYAMIVVASVPVLMLYPFAQKHFVKGVMIGSIKG